MTPAPSAAGMSGTLGSSIAALVLDVLGTVAEWRGSILREGETFGRARGVAVDRARFADACIP